MVGRFTARRAAAPELVPAQDDPSPALEGVSWTVFPEPGPEPVAAQAANPLLSDKLLDAKVRLHRRLIEEINLSALEKLPEDEMRAHIQQLVTQYILVERLALNTAGAQRLRLRDPRRDDRPRPARAAAQGPDASPTS